MNARSRIATFAAAIFLTIFLTSCGGGSSGGGGNVTVISVAISPSSAQTVDEGHSIAFTATVMNDSTGAGVTWTLTGAGTLTNTTSSAATYEAPATITTQSTATVTATSVTDTTKSASTTITLVTPLTITTTTLPDGTTGSPYSAQIATSGGTPPITFKLTSGSLPDGLTLSTSGLISGTPTGEGTFSFTVLATDAANPAETAAQALGITVTPAQLMFVTTSLPDGYVGIPYSQQVVVSGGVPPYQYSILSGGLPDGLSLDPNTGIISGTPQDLIGTSFMINVLDSEMPFQKHINEQLQIGILSAGSAVLNGQYAFQAAGYDPSNNPVAYVGSFTADGMGDITAGVEDSNDNGVITSAVSFSGTFGVARDNRGTLVLTLNTTPPVTQKFAFAMDSTGEMANLIEIDAINQASGTFNLADPTSFTLGGLAEDYAFGMASSIPAVSDLAARAGYVGRFTLDSGGTMSAGLADMNNNGTNMSNLTLTGSFGTPDANSGRGTASLTPGTSTIGLTYYIVHQGLVFVMENDANSGASVYYGQVAAQVGANSYSNTSLTTAVFYAGGVDFGGASVIAGQFTANPGTLILSGELDENDAGLVLNAVPFTEGTYSVTSNGRGTMQLVDTNLKHYYDAVFYLTNTNTAFMLEAGAQPTNNFIRTGMMVPQTGGPFTSAPNDGNYYGGSFAPTTAGPLPSGNNVAVPNIDDQFNLEGQGLSGIGDISDFNLINTVNLTGTYTFGDTFGRATVNLVEAGFGGGMASIYLISPTEFVLIPTNQFGQASEVALFQAQ